MVRSCELYVSRLDGQKVDSVLLESICDFGGCWVTSSLTLDGLSVRLSYRCTEDRAWAKNTLSHRGIFSFRYKE